MNSCAETKESGIARKMTTRVVGELSADADVGEKSIIGVTL